MALGWVRWSLSHPTLSHTALRRQLFHTQLRYTHTHPHPHPHAHAHNTTLSHTTLSHTHTHAQLCHTHTASSHTTLSHNSFTHTQQCRCTHNFVTQNVVTHSFVTHNFVTHNCVTHNFVMHNCVTHTHLSHTQITYDFVTQNFMTRNSYTLAQKHLCEFWCGMHLTCKNTPIKPDRSHWMIRSEKPQVKVWLALDNAVKQQQKTQYDVSPSCDLNAPRSDTAGTEVCVQTSIQTSIQLISIASLAWLGNQPSRPLQLKRRLDKCLVKYSKLVHCNGKEPDKKKHFRQSR